MTVEPAVRAAIVVNGRDVEVPEHYRVHVAEKMVHFERYDDTIGRYEVELFHESNPRQAKVAQRVEITARGAGPVVRAEACAPDFYGALAAALAKLETRLRRSHDRRRVHHGHRTPTSVAEATAHLDAPNRGTDSDSGNDDGAGTGSDPGTESDADRPEVSGVDAAPRIVREKEHAAEPTTVEQALDEMELVGHDFYLFVDACTGLPSVVYRRTTLGFGVIRLV